MCACARAGALSGGAEIEGATAELDAAAVLAAGWPAVGDYSAAQSSGCDPLCELLPCGDDCALRQGGVAGDPVPCGR